MPLLSYAPLPILRLQVFSWFFFRHSSLLSFDYSTPLAAVVATDALENASGGGPPAQHACLDCSAALTDRYCAHCGQPADTHHITLKHLLFHDVPHSIWHVDKGIAHTFWQTLTRPGLTVRGYLARLATEFCAKAAPRRRHAVAVAACARRPPKIARSFGRASQYFFKMSAAGIVAEQADQEIHCLSPVATFSFSIFQYLSLNRCVFGVALGYTARLPFAIPLVSNAPHRSYTVEDFTDLINARLQQLERRKEAQQHYGSLLVVLRQHVDAYRQRRTAS